MKKIISILLLVSIFLSVTVTSFAEANESNVQIGTPSSEEVLTPQEIQEQEALQTKYEMFKIQQQASKLSSGENIVYEGSFEDFDKEYQKIKEQGNKRRGPAFGTTKNSETNKAATVEEEVEENSISTLAVDWENSDSEYNTLVRPAFLNGINHPHLSGRSANEYISPFDGTLSLNFTDLVLPGKNGLDLNIGRYYKSEQGFVDLFASYKYAYQSPTTYLNKRYALGLGWGLSFPSVEVHEDSSGVIQATYHDGTGASYRSNYNDTTRDADGNATYNGYYIYSSNLDNYPNDNVRFREKDRTYSRNGQRSYFSFTDENNVKEYFTRTGELMAIVDRFGNEITFDYEYVRGENLIPFQSLEGNALGDFWFGRGFSAVNNNADVLFDGGSSNTKGTMESYFVELDPNCDQYYVNMLYVVETGLHSFKGTFDFYCDFYNEDYDLLGSKLIQSVTPTEVGKIISVDGEVSIEELELEEYPEYAAVRIEANGKKEIYFGEFRISPQNPLISTITDTVGRTVKFTYGADLYERYDSSDYVDHDILVEVFDPNDEEVRVMWYSRNTFSHKLIWDDEVISEDRYYLFWGAYNGEYWADVDYTWEYVQQSNIRWNWTRNYTVESEKRPYISTVYNRNSKTCYEYESVHKWLPVMWKQTEGLSTNTGFLITRRVTRRYDVNNVVDSESGENPKINIKTYDYTTGYFDDETGYNRRKYEDMYPGFLDPDEGKYIVVVKNSTGSTETYEYTSHTFNEGFRRKWKIELPLLDTHVLKESSSDTADIVTTEYTYTDNYAITSPNEVKVTETIDSESRTYYTINEYDDNSCLPVMTTLPLTESEASSVPKYKKIYTEYQKITDRFFVPIASKYYQSEDGTQLTQTTQYDSLGRIISQTDAAGNVVYTQYNETYPWLVSRVWYSDPENIGEEERISEVQYLYEDEYLLGPTTTRTKYADDTYAETKASYDPKYGGVITSTDAKGNTTTYTYDAMGRPYEIYYPAYNSSSGNKYVKEQFSYSKQGEFNNTYYFKLGKYIYDSGDSSSFDSILSTEICMYDDYGNLVYRQTDAGEEEYIYDNYNRAVKYKNYNDFGTDNISASCAYDMLNRIVSSTDAFGNSIYAVYKLLSNEYYFIPAGTTTKENHSKEYYDMYGNLIKTEVYPNGKTSAPITSTFTYDLAGNVLTSTDGNGNTVSFEYDSLGNNIKTVRPDGSIVENQFTKWGTSTKTTVIDGENRYSSNSDYGDDRGLATSIYSTGLDINTKPWYNEYDVNGSLLKTTAPNANTINYLYDNSGNLTQSVNGSQRNTFTYAFDGQLATQSKYVNDTLSEAAAYNYDSLERLISKTIGSDSTSYTYNTMGSVTSVTSPTGFTTAYTLDKAERVTGVGFDGKEITYEYYGDGMVKKITYPNSMTTEYSYDNANRVTDIVTTLGSTVLQSYSYTYDGNGNVLTVSGSENVTYTYDSLNRLASSTKNGVKTTYGYDSRNNLVSETDGTNTKTYEYGGDNRLHKVTENGVETIYEYDLNGNLIQRGEDLFAYDENNRLVYSKVDGVETMYEIGVEGLRSSKTTNGVTTTYKLNENGYVLVENEDDIIYGNTALAKKSDTNYYYYLYNAHGDVTAIVDEAGNVVNTYEYDPWGEIISQEETVSNSLKYAGEYYDEETGLIYLRNRYYEPSARRFTTEDPARDDLNWYCYCSNNPIVFVDPWGTYYIQKKNGKYTAKKSPWYAGAAKIGITFIPYGDVITYAVEQWNNVVGGTSSTKTNSVVSGTFKEFILYGASELAENVGKKLTTALQVVDIARASYEQISISKLDKATFNLMSLSNVSASSSTLSGIESKMAATSAFIASYSWYFTDEFRYAPYSAKTLFEIDLELYNINSERKRSKRIESYRMSYENLLKNSYRNGNVNITLRDAEGYALNFYNWLNNYNTRLDEVSATYQSIL